MADPTVLALPFDGRWLVQNSPARRVPSHGTDLWGERYAIDFVGVDEHHRTADRRDWRTLLSTEPPQRFVSFGRPVLAPADGVVVAVHDGEPDHPARRSQLSLLPYALGQAGRLRQGIGAIAGNHVVIELGDSGAYAALVHLRAGSLRVARGSAVRTGEQLAECGNSGNSTQPHLHIQVMDSPDPNTARGMPMAFRDFREWPRGGESLLHRTGMPAEGAVVEPA
ncbi:MAG: M23 family metallopeptidase [Hamadaea sp.]|nr:M23 family metallopeptidase [Hamadaea sp.]